VVNGARSIEAWLGSQEDIWHEGDQPSRSIVNFHDKLRRLLGNDSNLVSEVRSWLCPKSEAASGPTRRHLAFGRSFHSNQWATTLSLASRGSRRRRDRHPGSAAPRPTRRRAILPKTTARTGQRAVPGCDRQTKKLLGRNAKDPGRSRAQHGTLRQQSRRSLASANPSTGTANAPIQICCASATLPLPPQCRPESFPSETPLAESDESPTLALAVLRHPAVHDSGLRPLHDDRPLRTKAILPAQVDNAVRRPWPKSQPSYTSTRKNSG
jgi:hypothetical protein